VQPIEQLAAIQRHCVFQPAGFHGLIERVGITPERTRRNGDAFIALRPQAVRPEQ
jgi:hypothetical protein